MVEILQPSAFNLNSYNDVTYIVAVHGLKLEIRNLREMKRVYELDVCKLAEELSDMVLHDTKA